MRFAVGTGVSALILYVLPGLRTGRACTAAGALTTWLLLAIGPRSIVERLAAVMMIAGIAWVAGPRAAVPGHESLAFHLFGWLLAGAALTYILRPRSE